MLVLSLMALTTGGRAITVKPLPPGGPPSAWIEMAALAWAALRWRPAHSRTGRSRCRLSGQDHGGSLGLQEGGRPSATSKLKRAGIAVVVVAPAVIAGSVKPPRRSAG